MSTTLSMSAMVKRFDNHDLHRTESEQRSHSEDLLPSQIFSEILRERYQKDRNVKQHIRPSERKDRISRLVDRTIPEAVAFGAICPVPKTRDREAWHPSHE